MGIRFLGSTQYIGGGINPIFFGPLYGPHCSPVLGFWGPPNILGGTPNPHIYWVFCTHPIPSKPDIFGPLYGPHCSPVLGFWGPPNILGGAPNPDILSFSHPPNSEYLKTLAARSAHYTANASEPQNFDLKACVCPRKARIYLLTI